MSKNLKLSILLALVFAPLYLTFRSASADDFDTYSFMLALDHFDLTLQQPQPPGFPIYVFLGRRLWFLTGQKLSALTYLSALSGVVSVLLIYTLGHACYGTKNHAPAIGSALLFGLAPVSWLTAEKALSDMPGLAATLLALWLLWSGAEKQRRVHLMLGGLASGLALGLRPQNALPLFLLLGYIGLRSLLNNAPIRPLVLAAVCFLVGILTWLVPTLIATGGLCAYVEQVRAHAAHVGQADSLLGMSMPLSDAVRARAWAFGDTFFTSTVGVTLFAPLTTRETLRVIAVVTWVTLGLVGANWRQRETQLLAVWTLAVAGQLFVFETLDRPRLMLPVLPPLALLTMHSWAHIRQRLRATRLSPSALALLMAALATALLAQGVPLAAQLATVAAPPVQATDYVVAHYPPAETLIATAGSFRAVQVELSTYQQVYLYRFDAEAVKSALTSGTRYVVVFDRDQFPDNVMQTLNADGRYVPLEDLVFTRDRRVHTQHDQVRVQVLTPAEQIPPEALTLPSDGCIDLGTVEDGRYLLRGWFRPEDIGGTRGRWAGQGITSTLRVMLPAKADYHIHLRALAYPAEQGVTLAINGVSLTYQPLAPAWTDVDALLPATLVEPGQTMTLNLIHDIAQSPFKVTNGGSSDTRNLTVAYDWVCISAP